MYVLSAPTGFCTYYVQYVHREDNHLRMTTGLARAVRFRTAEAARSAMRPGETIEWVREHECTVPDHLIQR